MSNHGEYFPSERNLNDDLPDYIREELEHGLRSAFGDQAVVSDDTLSELEAFPLLPEED